VWLLFLTMYKYCILLLLLSSCIEDISPNLGENHKQVAVYCTFEENQPWKLVLQNTQQVSVANNSTTDPIKNAVVEIIGDDGSYRKLEHIGGGMYWLDTNLPQENVVYTLTVQIEGQETLKATDSIPKPFKPERYEQRAIPNESDIVETDWYFSGTQEVRYFFTKLTVSNIELRPQIQEQQFYSPFSTNNIVEGSGYFETSPFGAKDFRLKTKTSKDFTISGVKFTTMHQHLYQYYKAVVKQQLTQGNYFAEPINSTSNIENGIGIFAGEHHTVFGNYYDINHITTSTYELTDYVSTIKGEITDHIKDGVKSTVVLLENGRIKGTYQLGFDQPVVHFTGGWMRSQFQTDKSIRVPVKLYTDINIAMLQAGFPSGAVANGNDGLVYIFKGT